MTLQNVLHGARAVDRRRLVQLRRDALERGEIDDHGEPEPAPHVHRHDDEERLLRAGEELLRADAEPVEDVVDEAERRVRQPQEHDGRRDRGDGQGHEDRRPVEGAHPDLPVQGHGDDQPSDHRERHEERRVDQGVSDRAGEDRILRQLLVVGPADPRRVPGEQVVLLERQHQRPEDREDREEADEEDGGAREAPPGEVFGADEPLPPAATAPASASPPTSPHPVRSHARLRSFERTIGQFRARFAPESAAAMDDG